MPIIYVNDNFGRWQSDFKKLVDHCLKSRRSRSMVAKLKPKARDYFILKPKHSAFYSTALTVLLDYLGTRHLILTGIAGNLCVLYTANDAYMRDYHLCPQGLHRFQYE
jgi:nicotinamidase-related amidase